MTHDIQKRAEFLEALRERGTIYHAARATGLSRRTVYRWRDADAEFDEACDDALNDAYDRLEETLFERALKHDTVAGIFLLKGARPHRYRDNVKPGSDHQVTIVIQPSHEVPRPKGVIEAINARLLESATTP